MRYWAGRLLIGLIGLGGCQANTGVTPSPGHTAGPAAGAWTVVQARDKSFRFAVPAEAVNLFQPDAGAPGGYQCAYGLGPQDKQKLYGAAWSRLKEPADTPEQQMKLLEARLQASVRGTLQGAPKAVERAGFKGLQAEAVGGEPPMHYSAQVFLGKGRVFSALYAAPAEQWKALAESEVPKFFQQFEPLSQEGPETSTVPIEWKEATAPDGSFRCKLPKEASGQADKEACKMGCLIPGRMISAGWQKNAYSPASIRQRLGQDKTVRDLREVSVGKLKGLEGVGEFPEDGTLDYFRLVFTHDRVYRVDISGLKEDKALASDARQVMDSFQPLGQ